MIKEVLRKILSFFKNEYSILEKRKSPFEEFSYPVSKDLNQRPIFISGSGRSGTHMFAKLFELHEKVDSYHLDTIGHSVGDSFFKYAKWNNLPVSMDGLIESRRFLANRASEKGNRYLESNPVISLCIGDLYKALNSQVIISVRNPKEVVLSHYRKGWYKKVYPKFEQIPGYHYYHKNPNHAFSRIVPRKEKEYLRWLKLSRFGKCAWMWRNTYVAIIEQVNKIDADNFLMLYLNLFDYKAYKKICNFMDLRSELDRDTFNAIVNAKPGAAKKKKNIKLTEQEKKEFNDEIKLILEASEFDSLPKKDWLFE